MSFSHRQAANAIMDYARHNQVDPKALLREVLEFNLDSVARLGKNNSQALNIEIPVSLEGLGAVVEADIPKPPARQPTDKSTQTISV